MTRPATEQHQVCDCRSCGPRNDDTATTGRGSRASRADVAAEPPASGAAPAEPPPDLATPVSDLLTIGEVARAADVATSALRFYEAEGLVMPAGRTAVGYRLYDPEQIARVRFIRHAQRLGRAWPRSASCSPRSTATTRCPPGTGSATWWPTSSSPPDSTSPSCRSSPVSWSGCTNGSAASPAVDAGT